MNYALLTKNDNRKVRFILSLFILYLFSIYNISAQEQMKTPVEGIIGKSGALDKSAWAFFTNSAGLSDVEDITAGLGYSNDYNLKELSSRSLFLIFPTKYLVVSGGFVHQGFDKFNTQHYNIAFSRKMAPWLNLSVRPHFIIRHQEQLEDIYLFTVDAGLQLFPSDKVRFGFFIDNPAQSKWVLHNDEEEYQTTINRLAFGYSPSSNVDMEVGVFKQDGYKTNISYSMSGSLHKNVILRGAVSSSPIKFGLGIGVKWQGLLFDMGLSNHSTLGISSAFGITYSFAKKQKSE